MSTENEDKMDPSLEKIFDDMNQKHFHSLLDRPILRWNHRLRSSAGRFRVEPMDFIERGLEVGVIEIAAYLRELKNSAELIEDTMGHEMIHFWLWTQKKPIGHTPEFYKKMKEMGVSRYNQVPQKKPYRYLYRCPSCESEIKTKRKMTRAACASCCKKYAKGKFHRKFQLILEKQI